jgi:hypothetical protein
MPHDDVQNLDAQKMMMTRVTDAQWNGCPSGKVTQYKKIYLALGACLTNQPVNLRMP